CRFPFCLYVSGCMQNGRGRGTGLRAGGYVGNGERVNDSHTGTPMNTDRKMRSRYPQWRSVSISIHLWLPLRVVPVGSDRSSLSRDGPAEAFVAGDLGAAGPGDRMPPFLPGLAAKQAPLEIHTQKAHAVAVGQKRGLAEADVEPRQVLQAAPLGHLAQAAHADEVDQPELGQGTGCRAGARGRARVAHHDVGGLEVAVRKTAGVEFAHQAGQGIDQRTEVASAPSFTPVRQPRQQLKEIDRVFELFDEEITFLPKTVALAMHHQQGPRRRQAAFAQAVP